MSFITAVSGPIFGPYVYLLLSDGFVYIGETQQHPAIRWAEHLKGKSGFLAGMQSRGGLDMNYDSFLCISVFCKRIVTEFTKAEAKAATQALEHEIHAEIIGNPLTFGKPIRVISDTTKTAPRRFRAWGQIKPMVPDILMQVRTVVDDFWGLI